MIVTLAHKRTGYKFTGMVCDVDQACTDYVGIEPSANIQQETRDLEELASIAGWQVDGGRHACPVHRCRPRTKPGEPLP